MAGGHEATDPSGIQKAVLEQVSTRWNRLRRNDFCTAGRSGAKRVSGNTGEPRDEPAGKKRPAHTGCVLTGDRRVAALDRCTRIALRAAPCGSPRENRNAN